MRFSCQWRWFHSNMKRWLFTRKFENHIVTSYNFDWKLSIFYNSFSYLKVQIHSSNNLEDLNYDLIAYIYDNFLKFNDYKYIIKKPLNLLNISNNFSPVHEKNWAIESLLFRWTNKIIMCCKLLRVNSYMHENLFHIVITHWCEMKATKLKNLVKGVVNIKSKTTSIWLEHQ